MKRKAISSFLKTGLLSVPAAAMMLGAAHGAQIGINFQDNWGGTPYAPMTDVSAFGIPLANWWNAPSVFDSGPANGFSTNSTWSIPGGGDLKMVWSAKNTYSIYGDIPTVGTDQVTYGYLDDGGAGYSVTLSGWRGFASGFTITTIATSDSATSFTDVNVTSTIQTNTLQYLNNAAVTYGTGLTGTSTVSSVFATLNGNDSITIKGLPVSGQNRSCLAGILVDFTTGVNAPLIEVNPAAPTNTLYPGGSFSLNALASGTPALSYQWRKGGADLPGETNPTLSKTAIVVGDSGNYDVVVTNAYGAVTSAVAVVTVQNVAAPVITRAPASVDFYAGYPVTFSVEATGGQLTYQWKSNTVAISGATSSAYTISSITTSDAGTYTVEVNNPVGPMVSASATLTVKTPTGAYESAVVGTKPLLWFRTGELAPVAQDAAANSGSLGATGAGLYMGAVTHPVTGGLVASSDKAANFSGGKVSVPFNAAMNPSGDFTVDAWIKPANLNAGNRVIVQSMINGENSGNGNDRSGWAFRQNGAALTFLVGGTSGAPAYTTTATTANILTAGVWQHVGAVYLATTGDLTLLLNGVPVLTTNVMANGALIPNFAAPLLVGDRGYTGWTFAGDIDEVAVYPSALSSAQLLAHYDNGTNASPAQAYSSLITTHGAVEYLRLNDTPNLTVTPNLGTLGTAFNGTYKDGGGVLGSPQIWTGQAGPQPPTYPGFETTNRSVYMTNGYVGAPLCTNLNVNTITVAGWLKPDAIPSASDLGFPCWLGQGGMHIENSSGRPTRELRYHWGNTEAWQWGSGLVVPADTWTFVAMVVEPTKVTFYMSDGQVLKTAGRDFTHPPLVVDSPVGFGGGQSAGRTYRGGLDEFSVYTRALTQSEITTLFMVGTGAPLKLGLVPGGYVEDTKPTGTPHHGANFRSTWLASSADLLGTNRVGVQVFSNTASSQIVVPADPDFNSTVGTFTFWIRATAPIPGPGSDAAMIIDRRTSAGTVITLNNEGNILVQCAGGANSPAAPAYIPDDNWHHVAVTYDQSATGVIEIYVDGVLNNQQANTAAWSWPATQQIEIGASHDGYWKKLNGQLDDIRIYNRVLTLAEVTAIQTTGAIVDSAALKLRYDFGNTGLGYLVTWPFGTLLSSPTLGPSATWTPVPGATPPSYPILPTNPALYFQATP